MRQTDAEKEVRIVYRQWRAKQKTTPSTRDHIEFGNWLSENRLDLLNFKSAVDQLYQVQEWAKNERSRLGNLKF